VAVAGLLFDALAAGFAAVAFFAAALGFAADFFGEGLEDGMESSRLGRVV
jgi:hypothetical protein